MKKLINSEILSLLAPVIESNMPSREEQRLELKYEFNYYEARRKHDGKYMYHQSSYTIIPDLMKISQLSDNHFSSVMEFLLQIDANIDPIEALGPYILSTRNEIEFLSTTDESWMLSNTGVNPRAFDGGYIIEPTVYDYAEEYVTYFVLCFVASFDALMKTYRHEVRTDEFGTLNKGNWLKKIRPFIEQKVLSERVFSPNISSDYRSYNVDELLDNEYLFKCLKKGKTIEPTGRFTSGISGSYEFIENLTSFFFFMSERCERLNIRSKNNIYHYEAASSHAKGVEFENWCIGTLTERGWSCDATPKTGDQGADILARRGPILIVFQCKDYTSSVGNDAVQQVNAAKSFFNADVAAVVTNSKYTNSALQLADSLGVKLLHGRDLSEM